ncbi:hypothetical protein DFJ74DRAFT_705193 [Hyaloraphidium curvatum]|nr:hypothetical protein DFJ74DRAFT_705193 [Hyaloraphidium curvatum]
MTNASTPGRRSTGTATAGPSSAAPPRDPQTYADAASGRTPPDDDEMVAEPSLPSPSRASHVPPGPPGIPSYLRDTPVGVALRAAPQDGPAERPKFAVRLPAPSAGPEAQVASVPLPSAWNSKDKCSLLQLANGGLTVNYNGTGKNDSDAAAVRANHPVPPSCGLYYFEVDIVSKGRDGYIGIGFSHAGVSTNRLPGWEPGSWGYHGDDGNSFACYGTGKPYGPTFTTGDVIGCGVNFAEGNWSAFFTKNGKFLGVAFRDMRQEPPSGMRGGLMPGAAPFGMLLYPSVGLRTPGEVVEANFGHRPFRFDIDGYFKETKARIFSQIHQIPLPLSVASPSAPTTPAPALQRLNSAASTQPPDSQQSSQLDLSQPATNGHSDPRHPKAARNVLNDLVLSYLIHQGYTETAEAFAHGALGAAARADDVEMEEEPRDAASMASRGGLRNEAWVSASLMNKEIKNRQKIRDFIMDGSIDKAIEMLDRLHPTVLSHPVPLAMVSKASRIPGSPQDLAIPPVAFYLKVRRFVDTVGLMAQRASALAEPQTPARGKQPPSTPRRGRADDDRMALSTPARPGPADDSDEAMDSDGDAMEVDASSGRARLRNGGMVGSTRSAQGTPRRRRKEPEEDLLATVMAYGQELQNEYGAEEREPFRTALQECFSLLAYSDPFKSPLAHLLQPAAREPVANMVNGVILAVQGKPPLSSLEVVYRQTSVCLDETVRQGVAAASFVNLVNDCLL